MTNFVDGELYMYQSLDSDSRKEQAIVSIYNQRDIKFIKNIQGCEEYINKTYVHYTDEGIRNMHKYYKPLSPLEKLKYL